MKTVFRWGFVFSVIAATSVCSFAATDVLFLVDTTASMGGIEALQMAMKDILAAINADSPCSDSIMYAVADYRNYADGDKYQAYGVNLVQPFTSNISTAVSAIKRLLADGGDDQPESQLKALVTITENWLTPGGDLGFNGRANAQKILIWSGDAPGHIAGDEPGPSGSPPAGYYPSLDETIEALTAQWITVFALNAAGEHAGLDALYRGHHQASEITAATGGILFNSVGSGGSWIEDPIVEAITCLSLDKDDDLDDEDPSACGQPGQELTYTLYYANDHDETLENAFIIDWLPENVMYPGAEWTFGYDPNASPPIILYPPDPGYDAATHSYAWALGPIDPNASGSVQLTVTVNEAAAPGTYLHNLAELWGTVYVHDPNDPNRLVPEVRLVARAVLDTRVCCYITPPQILFVDETATNGAQTGVDWANAFLSLQDALAFARSALCGEVEAIYCAQGVYSPAGSEDDGFDLRELPGISLFGGFRPGGCDFSERSPKRYETILTGLIDEDEFPDAITVVTMGDETVLDGFTVMNGFSYNIYGSGVDFTITHCTVRECFFGYGIHADNGDVSVQWTTVNSNGTDGLYHEGEGYSLTVDNSWLLRNGEHGIRCESSTPTIRNSIVSENDLMRWGRQGIRLYRPTYQPRLYNLTVANNKAQAIYFEDDGDATGNPNNLDYPDLQNSILFFNGGGSQIAGFDPDLYANFCCIQDCNTIGTTNFNDEPGFAYQADPNGTPDPNNYHLAANSICIDRANPFLDYTAQVDIDGEGLDRKYGDFVDVGADEVYDCFDDYLSDADVRNDVDFDADGLVNLAEFSTFSRAWLSRSPYEFGDPNLADPNAIANWNPKCNLADTGSSQYVIDLADLAAFLEDWLWIACWRTDIWQLISQQQFIQVVPESMMVAGLQPAGTMSQAEPSVAEQTTQLISIIVALEQLWLDPEFQQEIDALTWQEFMGTLYQEAADLYLRAE